jgi:hypothetical protein
MHEMMRLPASDGQQTSRGLCKSPSLFSDLADRSQINFARVARRVALSS